jgi:hypothetical protein
MKETRCWIIANLDFPVENAGLAMKWTCGEGQYKLCQGLSDPEWKANAQVQLSERLQMELDLTESPAENRQGKRDDPITIGG